MAALTGAKMNVVLVRQLSMNATWQDVVMGCVHAVV